MPFWKVQTRDRIRFARKQNPMMDVRLMKKKNGELVLQKYTGVGQNGWGHVVFGWVDAETVREGKTDQPSPQENDSAS